MTVADSSGADGADPADAAGTSTAIAASAFEVRKVYGAGSTAVTALDGISFDVNRGEFTAIMGPSGSGKSTLMHVLAGLDTVTSGTIRIGDTQLSNLNDKQLTVLRRTQVGFVFQAYNLVPTLTARENITLPVELARGEVDLAWFDEIVRILGLGDRLDHRPKELSGGQQQRVAVARALMTRPQIVFADEPTGALDSNASAHLLDFLRSAADDLGQTIVMVTHEPTAASMAHRLVFLSDGQIVDEMRDPTPERVLDQMKALEGSH